VSPFGNTGGPSDADIIMLVASTTAIGASMIRDKATRFASMARRTPQTTTPAIVDGLFADPCWPDSTGNTRCVLCGKAVGNKYLARSNHARLHEHETWAHKDVLGRTLWFPRDHG
jgi:hypothetical protein